MFCSVLNVEIPIELDISWYEPIGASSATRYCASIVTVLLPVGEISQPVLGTFTVRAAVSTEGVTDSVF